MDDEQPTRTVTTARVIWFIAGLIVAFGVVNIVLEIAILTS